jgi:hypothetical protein
MTPEWRRKNCNKSDPKAEFIAFISIIAIILIGTFIGFY